MLAVWILSVFYFALAAPVPVGEALEVRSNTVGALKDEIVVSEKRTDDDDSDSENDLDSLPDSGYENDDEDHNDDGGGGGGDSDDDGGGGGDSDGAEGVYYEEDSQEDDNNDADNDLDSLPDSGYENDADDDNDNDNDDDGNGSDNDNDNDNDDGISEERETSGETSELMTYGKKLIGLMHTARNNRID
jgi:hypothetical protein